MSTHAFRPSTDEFAVTIVRQLTEQECDPDVGPMYEVLVHAYADELTLLPTAPTVTVEGLLDTLQDILYPLDQPRDHQWDGGDVCEALAEVVRTYRPAAHLRQRAEVADLSGLTNDFLAHEPTPRFCLETLWEEPDGVRLLCCLPLGHEGHHDSAKTPEAGWEAYRKARKAKGI